MPTSLLTDKCIRGLVISNRCQCCGGNLSIERDQYGAYISCLQCSSEHDEDGNLIIRRIGIEGEIHGGAIGYRGTHGD